MFHGCSLIGVCQRAVAPGHAQASLLASACVRGVAWHSIAASLLIVCVCVFARVRSRRSRRRVGNAHRTGNYSCPATGHRPLKAKCVRRFRKLHSEFRRSLRGALLQEGSGRVRKLQLFARGSLRGPCPRKIVRMFGCFYFSAPPDHFGLYLSRLT